MDILSIFAERLKEIILDAHTSPEIISQKLNHNVYDIYHWTSASNKYMPTVANIIKFADYFNCSVDFFIGLSEENSFIKSDKPMPLFSERFRVVLKEKSVNLYNLGKKTGASTTTYYRWLNNKAAPTIDSLIKVAAALDCSLDYLIGREW